MPYYSYPNVTTGFVDLLTYSNSVTSNFFGVSIIIATFMVLFIAMKTRGVATEKAFASCMFSTTLVTYIMVLIPGLISTEIIVIMTLVSAISIIFLYKTGSNQAY